MKYCRWLAGLKGWAPDSVRLPTSAEYLRALRGLTTRGDPTQADYWSRARFHQSRGIQAIRQGQFDKIFIPGSSQMYDLVGNVAEWGFDEKDGARAVLGGDFEQKDPGFNHLRVRWMPPQTRSGAIGLRFVHKPAP